MRTRKNGRRPTLAWSTLARSGKPITHTPSVLSGQPESSGAFSRPLDFEVGAIPGLVFSSWLLKSRQQRRTLPRLCRDVAMPGRKPPGWRYEVVVILACRVFRNPPGVDSTKVRNPWRMKTNLPRRCRNLPTEISASWKALTRGRCESYPNILTRWPTCEKPACSTPWSFSARREFSPERRPFRICERWNFACKEGPAAGAAS